MLHVSFYLITNWVLFEFVIFNPFIIWVVFGLMNIVKKLLLTRSTYELRIATPIIHNQSLSLILNPLAYGMKWSMMISRNLQKARGPRPTLGPARPEGLKPDLSPSGPSPAQARFKKGRASGFILGPARPNGLARFMGF